MSLPNWFDAYARDYFTRHLMPLAGKPGLRFLQIGVFTGDASVWLLENILTGRGSLLVDVDTWEGSNEPEHKAIDWADVEATYDLRVVGRPVLKQRMSSAEFFSINDWDFDFVYIDGDHTPPGVLSDAVHAFECLAPGGLLAFDDYAWTDSRTRIGPGPTIDAIANAYKGRLQLIQLGAQAWFRKAADR